MKERGGLERLLDAAEKQQTASQYRAWRWIAAL